ncbi:hypothetical protein HMPREF6123_1657 [Oribacterium sinus F0268]|uniref:Uncharacterized protein n=1 Tax=Oribacterium sinus F0268 TaxID=585501 RepID=C2KYT8_9FIRM|nr:hypothetical protein HMPREF6123_1657 [Oribacterium sinus F0268]
MPEKVCSLWKTVVFLSGLQRKGNFVFAKFFHRFLSDRNSFRHLYTEYRFWAYKSAIQ